MTITHITDKEAALQRENERLTDQVKRQSATIHVQAVAIQSMTEEIAKLKAACDKFSESEMLLKAQPVRPTKDQEQAAFEAWLTRTCPSGDVTEVHNQWEASWDYRELFEARPEPMVRYCPDCGSIGPVPATARDCCPDGQHARMVPENFAKSCRDTFMRAIAQPVQPAPLTFGEIESCFPEGSYTTEEGFINVSAQWLHDFARAIEAAVRTGGAG